jgi:ribosomal protein S10
MPGMQRQWVKCRECGQVQYYDFIPYSLGNPVMVSSCGHGTGQKDMNCERITEVQAMFELSVKQPVPSPELTWLYTHCKAIGMTKQSESKKWEHDIALFTIDQQERIKALEKALEISTNSLKEIKTIHGSVAATMAHDALVEVEVATKPK